MSRMHGRNIVTDSERDNFSIDADPTLDDLPPSERVAEIERRIRSLAGAIHELETARADALHQLRRERLSLSEIGLRIGQTRQQVHRLLRTSKSETAATDFLYVGGDDNGRRPVEVGAQVERDGVRYRVVRVQRMEPLVDGSSAPWAVFGIPAR